MTRSVRAGQHEALGMEPCAKAERGGPGHARHAHHPGPSTPIAHPSSPPDVTGKRKTGLSARPRLLDLFCGAGGAGMGYHRAGFDVVGVDIKPQPHYPFEFHRGDAIEYVRRRGDRFDAIHASPPCQQFTRAGHLMRAQGKTSDKPDMVLATRWSLLALGRPYVIENVEGAPLIDPALVCGSALCLRVRRHRLFESSVPLASTACRHREQGRPVGVYGSPKDDIPSGGRTARDVPDAQDAMGIDWMPRWDELKEAIPPAFTTWIGVQLLAAITAERAP